jgi:hypothetical protein
MARDSSRADLFIRRLEMAGTMSFVLCGLAAFAQDGQDKIKRVAKVDDGIIVVTTATEARVTISAQGPEGKPEPAPEVLASSASDGLIVVAIQPTTAHVLIENTQFPVGELPGVSVRDGLDGVTVSTTADGFSVKNDGPAAVVALIEEPGKPKDRPTCVIVQVGAQVNVPRGALTVVRSSLAVKHTWVAPAAGPEEQPQPEGDYNWLGHPEGWSLNLSPFGFVGITPHVKGFFGRNIRIEQEQVTVNTNAFGTFRIEDHFIEKDFDTVGAGVECNLGLITVTVEAGGGTFKGRGRNIHIEMNPPPPDTVLADNLLEFDGTLWWTKIGLHWPAVAYGSGAFCASIGPSVEYIYMEERVESGRITTAGGATADLRFGGLLFQEHIVNVGGRLTLAYDRFILSTAMGTPFGDAEGGFFFEAWLGVGFWF